MDLNWITRPDPTFEEFFRERWHRPPPFIRSLEDDEVDDLLWRLAERMKIGPSISFDGVMRALGERIDSSKLQWGMGWPLHDAVADAIAAKGLKTAGDVFITDGWERSFIEIRTRDLIEFERVFYFDNWWVMATELDWAICAPHDRDAFVVQL